MDVLESIESDANKPRKLQEYVLAGRLLRHAAHSIRSITGNMLLLQECLNLDPDSVSQRSQTLQGLQESLHSLQVYHDLLTRYAVPGPKERPCPAKLVLQRAASDVTPYAALKEISVCPPCDETNVLIDAPHDRVERATLHLLLNLLRFWTGPKGCLTMKCEAVSWNGSPFVRLLLLMDGASPETLDAEEREDCALGATMAREALGPFGGLIEPEDAALTEAITVQLPALDLSHG